MPYNKLLTNLPCSNRTGEYWPSVVFVRTSLRSVRTAMTSGQYSPVRPSRSVSKRLVNFKYNGKKEMYKVCVGMPILATQNLKDREIFNTQEFMIENISYNESNNCEFMVNGITFTKAEFSESFISSFCVTVYKYQGADINEHYNIHEINKMDKKQLYTALSRTTKFEHIHLNNDEQNNKYINRIQPIKDIINSKFNSLYKNGKIYKVTFHNEMVYVGSTCEELETRLKWHLTNNKSQVFKHKNNPNIELIVNAPSFDKKSLEYVENCYIEDYAKIYGKLLINIKSNPLKKVNKVEYKVNIENKAQLEERIAILENKLTIKDDTINKQFYFHAFIDGKRHVTKARYEKTPKDKALENINEKKTKNNKRTYYLLRVIPI